MTGYRTPPKVRQFQPGESGNPKGRPKGSRNLRTDLTQMLDKKVTTILENGTERQMTRQQIMLLSLFEKAQQGDVRAATSLINMVIKLDPERGDAVLEGAISEIDNEIVAAFLKRNQQTNPGC